MQFGDDMISYRDRFRLEMLLMEYAPPPHKSRQIHTGLYVNVKMD